VDRAAQPPLFFLLLFLFFFFVLFPFLFTTLVLSLYTGKSETVGTQILASLPPSLPLSLPPFPLSLPFPPYLLPTRPKPSCDGAQNFIHIIDDVISSLFGTAAPGAPQRGKTRNGKGRLSSLLLPFLLVLKGSETVRDGVEARQRHFDGLKGDKREEKRRREMGSISATEEKKVRRRRRRRRRKRKRRNGRKRRKGEMEGDVETAASWMDIYMLSYSCVPITNPFLPPSLPRFLPSFLPSFLRSSLPLFLCF